MSSNRADSKKSLQEMFQFLQSDFRNASKHDDVVRCLNASRMTKTLCCDPEKCENNNICVSRNISLSQEIDVINRIQDYPCDTTEFSATIKCSSDACSVSMLSENVNSNCNCDVMHCQQHKQISQSYMSYIYNLWRIRENRNLPLLVTKKAGTQWRNCFWRIFLIPFVILLLCTTICNADPNQCAVGLKTPGSKFSIKAFLIFNKKSYIYL